LTKESSRQAPKRLVVTADDFGLAIEVNVAVEDAHRRGILSAASLMVGAPAAKDAIARARALPSLRVGLHLALVEAKPVLPPELIPDLVDSSGWFRRDIAAFGAAIFFRPALRRQMAAEIKAQFASFAATGLRLDHVNAHQHFHLHPTLAGLIIAIGREFGMAAMRLPREPLAVLRSIDPDAPGLLPILTSPWTSLLARRLRRAGLDVPDQVFGLAWTGGMTRERIVAILHRLPPGLTEIYCHPAIAGGFRGAVPDYGYAEEYAALLAPETRAALQRSMASLGGFIDQLP
jgi:hopanoid biosynthesis associated protein HpnK